MKKTVLFLLALAFFAVDARAQINAAPREMRHNYVSPQQMVTIASNTPFDQAISILDTYSQKFLGKIIVDPENRTMPIGVNVDRQQWLDALETILRANGLWYKEYSSYLQITSGNQQVTVKGEEKKVAALPPGTPTLDSREVNIQAVFFEADLTKLNARGINLNFLIQNTWNGIRSIDGVTPNVSIIGPASSEGSVGGQLNLSGAHDFNFGTLSALFGFLESEDMGRILASPDITVKSGQAGHVQVGVDFFVTTKDFAGNTIQTKQNAGIMMDATPTVYSQDSVDFVSLDLQLQNSSAQGIGTAQLQMNTEQASTKVLLLNGEQTTVGGLYSYTKSVHREGIPVLKDLPWWVLGIRYLTGSDNTTIQTKELIILIKASILPTLRERFEAIKMAGGVRQKSLPQRLQELENKIRQFDPSLGK
ncbi:MAG: type II and III secretion system protein [Bacteroidetes bacterium]|nr:type II and III secretion system protein [Bacteroidota bacterium]